MSKLLSKLHKNQNSTDTSLYQIYLPKLHEDTLKYYRLDLFKEIAIFFNDSLQMSLESPTSISNDLLVEIGKCYCYQVAQSFVESFGQPKLCFSSCVEWCKNLLPDIGSSSSHPLNSGPYYLI